MNFIINKILEFLTYPIAWFWDKYKDYQEEESLWKIILLFAGSLSGLLLIAFALAWGIYYIFTCHFEVVLFIGVIIWLYAYVKDKRNGKTKDNAPQETASADPDLEKLQAQAEKRYPIMRNIIFQTLKRVASDISIQSPRLLQEIEIPGEHYILSHGICFYQYKLIKANPHLQYSSDDLEIFKEQLQNACSHLISSGSFPVLRMENYQDAYGNWYDAVQVDVLEDIGNVLILQAVFISPAYAEYRHQLQMNQPDKDAGTSIPDARWMP